MSLHFIYKITNLINGKIYIGQTNNPSLRWSQHKSNAKNNIGSQIITKAIRKYGYNNFDFQVIATCRTLYDVNITERQIIHQYESNNKDIGYNIDLGGDNESRPPEIGDKISYSLKEYYKQNSSPNKGIKLSDAWKVKISKSSIGKIGVNKNKTFSKEWRNSISKSLSGKERINKRKFSSIIEKEICDLYCNNNTIYSIAKRFNCYSSLIRDILIRNNVKIRQSKKYKECIFTEDVERTICSLYSSGSFSMAELARQFKCGKTTVRGILLRYGIKI